MLSGDGRAWYAALKAKDARFDGRFFVGVSSTGIYCRPICRAKLPKYDNCTFYPSAAAAEQAGYRPCLLCRPELAPGSARVDATASLAHRAARMLEEGCGSEQSIPEIAARLGCSDRHLRRAFAAELGVSPVQYLQTCRLLLAKGLLTDTNLPVIEVAMASGFGSLRRFNSLLKARYRLSPTTLRREASGAGDGTDRVRLMLGYRPPYMWQQMLDFLSARALPGVEAVQDGAYVRTVRIASKNRPPLLGWVRVGHRPDRNALSVTMDMALLPVLPQVLGRIRHLFDLACDPSAIGDVLSAMNELRPDLFSPGIRLPGCMDAFEMAVRAVLGQQITVKGARTLAARLVKAYGTPVGTGIEGLTHAFPSPEDILALSGPIGDRLGPLGITGMRARSIEALARSFAGREIDYAHCAQPEAEMQALERIPGIGAWTAHYIAMRAMGWPDAFPHADYGVRKALAPRSPNEILALAEAWRPWRSYATIALWNALEAQPR